MKKPNVSDNFSGLPEHLVHHILSFMEPKDVIRTGTLSKKFLSIWNSYPVLDFCSVSRLGKISAGDLLNHVDNRCSQYHGKTDLQQFRLSVDGPLPDDDRFDRAVSFAVQNRVRDLTLVVFRNGRGYNPLPPTIAFAKSITKLTLMGFKVENLNQIIKGYPLLEKLYVFNCELQEVFDFSSSLIKSIKLKDCEGLQRFAIESPSLQLFKFQGTSSLYDAKDLNVYNFMFIKVLSLEECPLTDRWIEKLLPQLVLLEFIKLSYCSQLKRFKVSNGHLKTISLKWCDALKSIEVGAINLECFKYVGSEEVPTVMFNFSLCKHLKRIELGGGGIPWELLREQLSALPELDDLTLSLYPFSPVMVEINHQHLKNLSIENTSSFTVKINTPKLVSFTYIGKLDPFVHHGGSTLNTTLTIHSDSVRDTSYFLKWLKFIHLLGPYNVLTLSHCRDQELIFPELLREATFSRLVNLKHMRIELGGSTTISVEVVDSLLWLSPFLETLVFYTENMEQETVLSVKFEYGRAMKEDNSILCRLDIAVHQCSYLKTIEIEDFGGVDEKENLLKYFKGKAKSVNWK